MQAGLHDDDEGTYVPLRLEHWPSGTLNGWWQQAALPQQLLVRAPVVCIRKKWTCRVVRMYVCKLTCMLVAPSGISSGTYYTVSWMGTVSVHDDT